MITLSPIILDGKSPEEWKGKYPPWELTYPLPKRYFWVDDYVPFPKMAYVSSLEGRTCYHYVAMILKLFVPDPLWGRLIDILLRAMPFPIMSSPDSVSIRWWSFKNPLFKPWILCKCARVETPNIISHILEDGHQPNSRGLYTHYKDSLLKVCLKHFSSPAPSKIDWIPRVPRLLKLHISCYPPQS